MSRRFVPFAYGFRPFFLLAGVYACVAILIWLALFSAGLGGPDALLPQLWHAHEMLFGFVAAAIAGFMLTAVPSWTGSRGFGGMPLIAVVALWLAGRIALLPLFDVPFAVVATAELLFLPGLLILIAPALLRSINRNTPLMFVLVALWACDVWFLLAVHDRDFAAASNALRVALGVVLLLITIIGGRITPAFTANALRRRGIEASFRSSPIVERLLLVAMLAYVAVDALLAPPTVVVFVAAFAAALHMLRLSRWHSLKTFGEPIVWILHVAYLALPVGLALRAVHTGAGFGWAAFWQHSLGIGAAATMILAVMTRASLGHTGRELGVSPLIVIAYVALSVAMLLRVFGPFVLPLSYSTTILLAGGAWLVSFALFVIVYTPILITRRVDGRPG